MNVVDICELYFAVCVVCIRTTRFITTAFQLHSLCIKFRSGIVNQHSVVDVFWISIAHSDISQKIHILSR